MTKIPAVRLGLFFKSLIFLVVVYGLVKLIKPPLPASLVNLYVALALMWILFHVTTSSAWMEEFARPIAAVLEDENKRFLRSAFAVIIPLSAGFIAYQRALPSVEPPAALRTVHPSPPGQFIVGEKTFIIRELENPLRPDSANFEANVRQGGEIYFTYCVSCHGDALDGKGIFAKAYNPPPADFTDIGTIAQLQESYLFWRITQGGPGLPPESAPWNSAMPAWKGTLTEEQVWQVILFLYEATGHTPRTWEQQASTEAEVQGLAEQPSGLSGRGPSTAAAAPLADAEAGRELYEKSCVYCHGETGEGDGPASDHLDPRPRNFASGLYEIRTTLDLPTDQDLFNAISIGMPGSSMPGWSEILTEQELNDVVAYIKTFSRRLSRAEAPNPIEMGQPPEFSAERALAGGDLFFGDLECYKCHGDSGRGNGVSAPTLEDDFGFRIWPANLTQPWNFRGGNSLEAITVRFRTGMLGTPMPSFEDEITLEQAWNLAFFVRSLAISQDEPAVQSAIRALPAGPSFGEAQGENLPADPADPRWDEVTSFYYPLAGQIQEEPRHFTPSIGAVWVQALYDEQTVAVRIVWDDATQSPHPEIEQEQFPDAVAVQFPSDASEGAGLPRFIGGDGRTAVNLWYWNSDTGTVEEQTARSIEAVEAQPAESQMVSTQSRYDDGQWQVVMMRALSTGNNDDSQLDVGRFIPIAFSVWDGSNGEMGGRRSLSAWYFLYLEQPVGIANYLSVVLVVVFVALLEVGLFRFRRSRRSGSQQQGRAGAVER